MFNILFVNGKVNNIMGNMYILFIKANSVMYKINAIFFINFNSKNVFNVFN
jgi:hypothetical protein